MPETEEHKYPEILPVIEEYLKKQQAAGEQMRIHFWDTNHDTPEPAQVFSDKSLHDLVKKFGTPLYIIEDNLQGSLQKRTPISINDKEQIKNFNDVMDSIFIGERSKAIGEAILYSLSDDSLSKVHFPDPRPNEIKEFQHSLSKKEQGLFIKSAKIIERFNFLHEEQISNTPELDWKKELDKEIKRHFSKTELKTVYNMQERLLNIIRGNHSLDTSQIDEKISNNTNAIFDPNHNVQVTLYGAAHFTKQNDLNEHMEGISIAVADKNKLQEIRTIFTRSPYKEIHNQFPDYTYYPNEKRLVKMDNDAAKAEFLGLSEEQFKAWKASKSLDEQIKLKYDNIAGNEIPASQTYLLPPKIGNNKQPSMNV